MLRRLPGWVPAVLLLVLTLGIGPALGGAVRPLFVLGCGAAGWWAWRKSPAAHLQAVLALFCFAPFVRRVVDVSAGFDQQSLMLIGPLLAILAPAVELRRLAEPNRPAIPGLAPGLVVIACVFYGALLSMFQADWFNAANGALKWIAPILYALVLQQRGVDGGAMAQAAARAFLLILPIMGLYGLLQYFDPQRWDIYWMQYASITSAGYPVPFGIRLFSTMNGPASYATFTAAGLLMIGFLRPGWQSLVAAAPASLGLLLSLYRTAWISLAVGVLFCLLFAATRRRAATTAAGIVAAAALASVTPPFSDVIAERLESLSKGSQDGSSQERMEEFVTLWNLPDSGLMGSGFTITDAGQAGAMPIDGQIVANWVAMGIVVGLICLFALVWAAVQAIVEARRGTREAVVLGAMATCALVQLPLAGISSGELGVLFWTFAALAVCRDRNPAPVRPSMANARA